MSRRLIVWIFFTLSFALCSSLQAEILRLKNGQSKLDLAPSISFFEDSSRNLSLTEIIAADQNGSFISTAGEPVKNFGFTRNAVWFKVNIRNESNILQWNLGSLRPDFYSFQVFVTSDQQTLQNLQIGTLFTPRSPNIRMPFGKINLPQNQDLTLYFRIQSDLQLAVCFLILSDQEIIDQTSLEQTIFAAYYGCLLALLFYNLCLFLIIRNQSYLMYVFFAGSMLLNVFLQGGFAEFLRIPWFLASTRDAHLVICLPAITAMLYTRTFLNIKLLAPWLNRLILWTVGLESLLAIVIISPWGFPFRNMISLFDIFSLSFVFLSGIVAWRHQDKTALVFLLGWGSLAASVALWTLGNIGVIHKTTFVALAPLLGNIAEMILMSIALALRIKDIQKSRIEAELKAKERENLQHILRMLCHDISNPLLIVDTSYYIASRSSELKPEERKSWERVKRAADSIAGIINQVRRYEAFRSRKLAFETQPCSIKKVFDDVDFFFQSKAKDKGVSLSFSFSEPESDVIVMADTISLTHEIFNNLVSNAIKFTAEGGSVKLEAKSIGEVAIISVKDTGIGIPPHLVQLLFDSKAQTSRPGTNQEIGTGFGMPLVKTFVEMFGGSINITSFEKRLGNPQHGTTIEIRLPIAPK